MASTRRLKESLDSMNHLRLMSLLIGEELQPGKAIRSPVRAENNPSFNVFRSRTGKYLWKDFAGEEGDVYKLAMQMHQCTFAEAVKILSEISGIQESPGAYRPAKQRISLRPLTQRAEASFLEREWAWVDGNYWTRRFQVDRETFYGMGAMTCLSVEIRKKDKPPLFMRHTEDQPLYAYIIDGYIKSYRPLQKKKRRYAGNTGSDQIFGLSAITPERKDFPMVITAGQKDALVLACAAPWLNAVSLNSETTSLTEEIMKRLVRVSSSISICYDRDAAGLLRMGKACEEHPILDRIDLECPCGSCKDIADVVEAHGREGLLKNFKPKQ